MVVLRAGNCALPQQLLDFKHALQLQGFDIFHPLSLAWYNNAAREAGADIVVRSSAGEHALALLIGNTRDVWPHFKQYVRSHARALPQNPFDAFVVTRIADCLLRCCSLSAPRVFWAHERVRRDEVSGDASFVALQRAAHASALAYLDTHSHLCVHPTYGPWFALRALIVFDDIDSRSCIATPAPCPLPDPCSSQVAARIEAAMQHALHAAAHKGATMMDGVMQHWQAWLAVRDAFCPEHAWRYDEQQLRYHYTRDPLVLQDILVDDPVCLQGTRERDEGE